MKAAKPPSDHQSSEEGEYQEDFDTLEKPQEKPQSEGEEGEYSQPEEVDDQREEEGETSEQDHRIDSKPTEEQDDRDDSDKNADENDDEGKDKRKKKHMKFDILLPRSIRLLFDMTAYIGENEPEDLFNEYIYEQLIKTRRKQNMVELISADDFFNVLVEHKVIKKYTDSDKVRQLEQVKENIKELLCLDPQYMDLLMMKKINKTVKEIIDSEELQAKAREVVTSDDEAEGEGDEIEEDYEEEGVEENENDEEDQEDEEDRQVQDTGKKSIAGSMNYKFSPRSSSGFSREEDHNQSSKKKGHKKKLEHSDIEEKKSDDYDDEFEKGNTIKSQQPNQPNGKLSDNKFKEINPSKTSPPQKKFDDSDKGSDIDEEIEENIQDNYEFNF
jgi:hypothetical protein